jgi:hypothetical protein
VPALLATRSLGLWAGLEATLGAGVRGSEMAGRAACRIAEPRLSGFAGQATLAWATF